MAPGDGWIHISTVRVLARSVLFPCQNLDLGAASNRLIPPPDGLFDSLSDINGNTIVFLRVSGTYQGIYRVQVDPFGNAVRRRSAIGGDTTAYQDFGYDPSATSQPEISLSSVSAPVAPAYRLTDDTISDQWPAVSIDGNAVVWVKCSSATVCDVWRAERTADARGNPEQVTSAEGNETFRSRAAPTPSRSSTSTSTT